MNQNIIKFLAYLSIFRFMIGLFYRVIVWVADVGSPYSKKKKKIYDECVSEEDKKELYLIKQKSKKTRRKIAIFSFIVSFALLYNSNPFDLYVNFNWLNK